MALQWMSLKGQAFINYGSGDHISIVLTEVAEIVNGSTFLLEN
jgi:hypothetical protein